MFNGDVMVVMRGCCLFLIVFVLSFKDARASPPALTPSKAEVAPAKTPEERCVERPDDPTDISDVICYRVDEIGKSFTPVRIPAKNATANDNIVILPNRQLIVRVMVRANGAGTLDAEVSLGGTPGETKIRFDGDTTAVKALDVAAPNRVVSTIGPFRVYETRFVPRTTGYAPLTITLTKPKDEAAHDVTPDEQVSVEHTTTQVVGGTTTNVTKWTTTPTPPQKVSRTFEFLVPNQYAGALRIGLSAVFGLNEHAYAKRQAPTSAVMEIVDEGPRRVMPELVVGFAPYPQAFTRARGRDYVRYYRASSFRYRLAPYLGLGLLSVNTSGDGTKLRWLNSFYLGGEWELFQSASIAVAATVSRVDHLATGLEVGGPVAKDTDIIDRRFGLGVAVVINFTPDFFKFAAGFK